jgi:general stress protein 26
MAATMEADTHKVWEMAAKIRIAMLTNWDGRNLHSRPMSAHGVPEENAFYFLADKRHHKNDEVKEFPVVNLAFTDGNQQFVTITGDASVSTDRDKIKELWSVWAKAWWDSPDDPNICILKVTPTCAEYWDSPGTVVSSIKMAVAAMTDGRPDMGDNRKVSM